MTNQMDRTFQAYFRCPENFARVEAKGELHPKEGYFQFGPGVVCYGKCSGFDPSEHIKQVLPDSLPLAESEENTLQLPFELSQVVDNLRFERYRRNGRTLRAKITDTELSRKVYYFLRPVLPVNVRQHLQRGRLKGWEHILFPHWPVDFTVDSLMQRSMALMLKGNGGKRIPFIWFWPNRAKSCVMMTHDVEAKAGRDFCGELMNIDDSFGFKSAFQIVPELRYTIEDGFIEGIWRRGFEVNVHDLNHDGALFQEKDEFVRRAGEINRHAKVFETRGFRAGQMYRNQEWFSALEMSYDMSVPSVAHLEPQRGGCCTVMPYFIGEILELPLTTTQDYSLFHILDDYSIDLWKRQIELIRENNGLISFITHPDYLIENRARAVYRELLGYLAKLREEGNVWTALPSDIDKWWRSRNQMTLVPEGDSWRIEGLENERASVAYASLENGKVVYSVGDSSLNERK